MRRDVESKQARQKGARGIVLLGLALGCILVFTRALALGLPAANSLDPQVSSVSANARLLCLLIIALVSLVRAFDIGRIAFACCGLLMAASCWGMLAGTATGELAVFAAIAGVASAVVMLGLMLRLAQLSLRDIALAGLVGLICGGLMILATLRLPADAASVVLLVSALGAGVLPAFLDAPAAQARLTGEALQREIVGFPWFAAVMFALSGFLPSVLYGMGTQLGWNTGAGMNYPLFGLSIVLVLAATLYVMLQGEEVLPAIWVPLFALALTAMGIVCVDDPSVAATANALLMAGVFSYHFLRWVVFSALLSQTKVPRMPFAAFILLLTGSVLNVNLGVTVALGLPAGLQQPGGAVAVLALMLSLVFAAALLVARLRERTLNSGFYGQKQGVAPEADEQDAVGEQESDPLSARCDALAAEFDLTPREAEIFKLTARGHSSTFIADQLVISASTVRFHQQNIYRKLGVHSRQEVLALANGE